MMNLLKRPWRILLLYLIVSIIILSISYKIVSKKVEESYHSFTFNKARVLTNSILDSVKQNYRTIDSKVFTDKIISQLEDIDSEMEIVDIDGRVIFDSSTPNPNMYDKNRYVDLETYVHFDASFISNYNNLVKFAFPIVIDGRQVANAIFTIPEDIILEENKLSSTLEGLIPLFIVLLGTLIFGIIFYYTFRRQIIYPIKQLDLSANEIARGNYDMKIDYYNENELGRFSRTFDLMRMELKDALERQSKYEKSRKELITKISHDLKTPVSSIKAYVEGLKDGIAKDPAMIDKYLNIINKKTEGLVKLIDDLFEHSLAEVGEFKISKEEIYSKDLLENMIEAYKLQFEDSEIKFIVEGNIPDLLINVDTTRIEQVVSNLIKNAEKYTPPNGKIIFSLEKNEENIKISIKDSGYGISEKDMPYIFDDYYRSEDFVARDFEGSGLGLSICKYIVEQHGGKISVYSKLNEGSIFSFTIPKV